MAQIDPNPEAVLTLEQHETRLESGWQWLERHSKRRDADERCDLWITWLRAYERHYTALQSGTLPHLQGALL